MEVFIINYQEKEGEWWRRGQGPHGPGRVCQELFIPQEQWHTLSSTRRMPVLAKEVNMPFLSPVQESPCSRKQDSPVGESWKPSLEKVPTISSSQISIHFLGPGPRWQFKRSHRWAKAAVSGDPHSPPRPSSLRAGSPCVSPENMAPRHLGPPVTAVAEQQPPQGPLSATSQCEPENQEMEKQLEIESQCSHRSHAGGRASQAGVHCPRESGQDLGEFGPYVSGSPEGTVGCGGSHL